MLNVMKNISIYAQKLQRKVKFWAKFITMGRSSLKVRLTMVGIKSDQVM